MFKVKRFLVRAVAVAAIGALTPLGVRAVDCVPCDCPKTKTKDVPTQYSGINTNCSNGNQTTIGVTVGTAPTGGGGNYSGSGTNNAVCWVSYTIDEAHKEHDGAAEACSKVSSDGQWYTRIWSGGGCTHHNPIGPNNSYYTCNTLTNSSNNPHTNQMTEDC